MTIQIDTTTSSGIVLILGALVTLVGAVAGAIVTVVNAVHSTRQREEVKATAVAAAEQARTAAELGQKGIEQNEQIITQTNGNHSDLVDLLKSLIEVVNKQPPPTVVVANGERRVRSTDVDAAAAAKRG